MISETFQRPRYTNYLAQTVAFSVSGIVIFLSTLLDGGCDVEPELMGLFTVISGHIEIHGRPYLHLKDLSDYDLIGIDYRNRQDGGGPGPDPLFEPSTLSDNYSHTTLAAKQRRRGQR